MVMQYIFPQKSKNLPLQLHNTKWMITQKGLQQLRDLERIRHRDLTIWISGLALAISLFTLAINLG